MAIQAMAAIKAAETAATVLSRAKAAKDGMEMITSRGDDQESEVDHGKVFDNLNFSNPMQLSPGHNTEELGFFQSVLQDMAGESPEEPAGPSGPEQSHDFSM